MSWIEVRSQFEKDLADLSPMIELYRDFGIENTLEETSSLTGCLVDVDGTAARVEDLRTALLEAGAIEVNTRELPEDNWEEAWKAFFKPRRVGRRIVIRPTWEGFESESGDKIIVLDPGQAFGTGDHPTTRMCLELLENSRPVGKHVLDLGCGSGILAVGACLLGAGTVEATDIDPLAVEVAKQNAALNHVQFRAFIGEGLGALAGRQGKASHEVEHDEKSLNQIRSVRGDEEGVGGGFADEAQLTTGFGAPPQHVGFAPDSGSYDIVLSNIISATLIRLAPEIFKIVSHGGLWIVSGIIVANWPDVKFAAHSQGFELVEKREEDGWVAAGFIKF
jgi:ribosomal protein L11 methyltransferase